MNREQIAARLAAIGIRMAAIQALIGTESRTLSQAEEAEIVTLTAEEEGLNSTDRFLARLETRATAASAAAAEPARLRTVNAPAVLTKTTQAQRDGDKFKGQSYARYVIACAMASVKNTTVEQVMAARFGRTRPELCKLASLWQNSGLAGRFTAANEIPGGGKDTGEWGAELVQLDGQYSGDFIDLLREATVFDQLPLTEVPANVTIKGQDGTGAAYWTGEGRAIKMSKADFSAVSLTPLKIGALSAISLELIEDSSPAAESLVTSSLVKDSAQLLDSTFFSATAASAGVSPAGMLASVSQVAASAGTDLNGLITDTDALVQAFITDKNMGGLYWATLPSIAHKIGSFRNLMGQKVYDSVTEEGGTYDGKPMKVSDNVGAGDLILMKPSDIYKIGDSGLSVDISKDATLEFSSAPTGIATAEGTVPTAASAVPVNLFQAGMVGIRLFRRINWAKRRSGAVKFIGNTAYVPQIQTA